MWLGNNSVFCPEIVYIQNPLQVPKDSNAMMSQNWSDISPPPKKKKEVLLKHVATTRDKKH
jgi:hypothetical protein